MGRVVSGSLPWPGTEAAASPDSGTVLVLTRIAPLPAAPLSSSLHCFCVSFCDDWITPHYLRFAFSEAGNLVKVPRLSLS